MNCYGDAQAMKPVVPYPNYLARMLDCKFIVQPVNVFL